MPESITIFGAAISLYYLFWFFGLMTVLVVGYFLGKNLHLGFTKSILYVVLAVAIGYLLLWATSFVAGGGKMAGLNFVRIVTILPIPIFLVSMIFGDTFDKVADMIAPLLALFHGVTHIGCIFEGCCHGYPANWGIYSNLAETTCFPIQLIEALSSILIGIILLLMLKYKVQKGKLYAWYLLLYGGTRFGWEFLRDNEKVWNGVSELAIHALIAFSVGLILLIILTAVGKRRGFNEKIEI